MLIPTKTLTTFKELKCGSLFAFINNRQEGVWCKTPIIDMQNKHNEDLYINEGGAFCTALCVTSDKFEYIQCNPDCLVVEIDTKAVFEAAL